MSVDTVKITDELELWTYPDGRTVLHVQAEETATQARMFGEVDVPDVAELVRKLQAATPAPTPPPGMSVIHSMGGGRYLTGGNWTGPMDRHELSPPMLQGPDTVMVVCSAGDAWSIGQPGQVDQDMARHLEIVGVGQPAAWHTERNGNRHRASSPECSTASHAGQPEPVTHEATTDPELWDTDTGIYVLACTCGTWETRGTTAEITAEFDAHLDAMGVPANDLEAIQRAESAFAAKALGAEVPTATGVGPRVFSRTARGLEDVDDTGLMAAVRRMPPGRRAALLRVLEESPESLDLSAAEAVDAVGNIAEAVGMDRQSVISHTPAELGRMVVDIIRHRERVKRATELSRAVAQFPEILATAAPELRQALRTMLADAADALAEPEPRGSWPAPPTPHHSIGRCWCSVAHLGTEAAELNRRAGL